MNVIVRDCGCESHLQNGRRIYAECPLHAAAPAMLEALQQIRALANEAGDERSMDIAHLAATALAQIEGGAR